MAIDGAMQLRAENKGVHLLLLGRYNESEVLFEWGSLSSVNDQMLLISIGVYTRPINNVYYCTINSDTRNPVLVYYMSGVGISGRGYYRGGWRRFG